MIISLSGIDRTGQHIEPFMTVIELQIKGITI